MTAVGGTPGPGGTPGAGGAPGAGDARLALVAEVARCHRLGWMPGTSGNLSIRLGTARGGASFAITASGVDKGEVRPGDLVDCDAGGAAVDAGGARRPSAEAVLHARVYRLTGAGAVLHVHSLAPVLAADRWPTGIELADVEMLKGIGRRAHGELVRIPVVANSQDMAALGDAVEAALVPGVPAVVVARHGTYAWGDSLVAARHHLEVVDWLCRYALGAAG